MKEFYRVQHWSQYTANKSVLGSSDFNTIEEASKEYNRVTRLGYAAELTKITVLK